MNSARPLKHIFKMVFIVVLTGLLLSCAALKPANLLNRSKASPADSIAGFRYDIPRPVLLASAVDTPNQNSSATTDTTSASKIGSSVLSKFKYKSFIDKILPSRKKPEPTIQEEPPVFASIKLPDESSPPAAKKTDEHSVFCDKLDKRLSSISLRECLSVPLHTTGHSSEKGSPILRGQFGLVDGVEPTGRILLLGGMHGDELSSISIVFEWMQFLKSNHKGEFVWDVVPVMNPDGLFGAKPSRVNANGVDLNRNMPTSDWQNSAIKYWRKKTGSAPRKFPGNTPASESETKWLVKEIDQFQPDMIVSVHAPHNLIDYDAPNRKNAPRKFGHLKGGLLGTFPGSLGNYAGVKRGIPVVTIELSSADKAVSLKAAHEMWSDMLVWLAKTIPIENENFMENRRYAKAVK